MMRYMRDRGQALTEFAIFGSFILLMLAVLLQVGMSANALDSTMMRAFRNALYVAKQRSAIAGDDNNPPPNAHVNLVVYNDTLVPNPTVFGSAPSIPTEVAYNDVVWSHRLSLKPSSAGLNSTRYRNGVDYVINHANRGTKTNIESWERVDVSADRQESINNGPGYKTEGLLQVGACQSDGQCRKRVENVNSAAEWWSWKPVLATDSDASEYIKVGELLDVDGDNVEESIVALRNICQTIVDDEGNWIRDECTVDSMYVMDNSVGDIDTNRLVKTVTYKDSLGNEKTQKVYQGVDPEYYKDGNSYSVVIRKDSPGKVSSSTHLGASDTVRRPMVANRGSRDFIANPSQNININYESKF